MNFLLWAYLIYTSLTLQISARVSSDSETIFSPDSFENEISDYLPESEYVARTPENVNAAFSDPSKEGMEKSVNRFDNSGADELLLSEEKPNPPPVINGDGKSGLVPPTDEIGDVSEYELINANSNYPAFDDKGISNTKKPRKLLKFENTKAKGSTYSISPASEIESGEKALSEGKSKLVNMCLDSLVSNRLTDGKKTKAGQDEIVSEKVPYAEDSGHESNFEKACVALADLVLDSETLLMGLISEMERQLKNANYKKETSFKKRCAECRQPNLYLAEEIQQAKEITFPWKNLHQHEDQGFNLMPLSPAEVTKRKPLTEIPFLSLFPNHRGQLYEDQVFNWMSPPATELTQQEKGIKPSWNYFPNHGSQLQQVKSIPIIKEVEQMEGNAYFAPYTYIPNIFSAPHPQVSKWYYAVPEKMNSDIDLKNILEMSDSLFRIPSNHFNFGLPNFRSVLNANDKYPKADAKKKFHSTYRRNPLESKFALKKNQVFNGVQENINYPLLSLY